MLTSIGDVLRKCYERGWITTRDGNISLRKSIDGQISKYLYITPKGVRKYNIHPEDIVKLDINQIKAGEDSFQNASTEFMMHYLLQVDATSTRAVVHAHPTHVVAAMFAGWDLKKLAGEFPEISRYTKVGPTVGFYPAGSGDLAVETNKAFRHGRADVKVSYDIVGQMSHGVCAVGKTPWDCLEHIERLDHVAEIVIKSGVRP